MNSKAEYNIIQSNGQRIYNASSSNEALPPRGSEVFVGNLPRDLFENELIPLFSQAGTIFKLRLMMDFSGQTRGFAFVTYHTVEAAKTAVLKFNKRLVKSKTRQSCMTVHISLDNCRLFFGNVPKEKTAENIEEELMKVIDRVVRVYVYEEKDDPLRNRGFAFVEFESHAAAAIARRKLLAGVMNLWCDHDGGNHRLYVDWAEPEPIVDPLVLMEVKILYFKNVPINWTGERFKEFVMTMLKNLQIVKIYKRDNYAFVHFQTRAGAEMALSILQTTSKFLVFSGKQIEAEWARPSNYSKKSRANQWPDNFCTSVPPRTRKLIRNSKRVSKSSHDKGCISNSSEDDLSTSSEKSAPETNLHLDFEKLSLYADFHF